MDKPTTVRAIAGAPPWATFEVSDVRVIEAGPEVALVTYRATAQRHGVAPCRATFTTVYPRREGI